jgi:hypothetical protein
MTCTHIAHHLPVRVGIPALPSESPIHAFSSHLPGRSAHHFGWSAIARVPRATMRKRSSCKRGSASVTFVVVPGPDQKSSAAGAHRQQDDAHGGGARGRTGADGRARPHLRVEVRGVGLLGPEQLLPAAHAARLGRGQVRARVERVRALPALERVAPGRAARARERSAEEDEEPEGAAARTRPRCSRSTRPGRSRGRSSRSARARGRSPSRRPPARSWTRSRPCRARSAPRDGRERRSRTHRTSVSFATGML